MSNDKRTPAQLTLDASLAYIKGLRAGALIKSSLGAKLNKLDKRAINLDSSLVSDALKWITIRPNGKGANLSDGDDVKGRPVLIDGDTGQIVGGAIPKSLQGVKLQSKEQRAKSGAKSFKEIIKANEGGASKSSNTAPGDGSGTNQSAAPEQSAQTGASNEQLSAAQKEIEALKKQIEALKSGKSIEHKLQVDTTLPDKIPNDVILQNRDRSNVASANQMADIASKLDYYKVGTSNDFNSGCPVVSFGSFDDKAMGKTTILSTPKGQRLNVQYAVVEAQDVQTSHNIHGDKNDLYNSSDPKYTRAIAGNGRMSAITACYERYQNKANEYKEDLIKNASDHGCDPELIKGMKNPVLVRVMQPKDVTKDIGDQTNITQGLTLNAVEQARNDVNRLKNVAFDTYEDGSPTVESVKAFINSLPKSEQAGLLTKEGEPTRSAQDRLQNAMMMKGYNNDYLVRLRGQAINPTGKNLITALANSAGAFASLDGAGEYDIRNILAPLIEGMAKSKTQGGSSFFWQNDFFEDDQTNKLTAQVARMVANNKKSADKLTTIFKTLGQELSEANEYKQKSQTHGTLGSFVDFGSFVRTPEQVVSEALIKAQDKINAKDAAKRQRQEGGNMGGLFSFDAALAQDCALDSDSQKVAFVRGCAFIASKIKESLQALKLSKEQKKLLLKLNL